MEALVKGLTQELLDLKSVAMKMNKQSEERSRQELKRGHAVVQDAPAPAAAPRLDPLRQHRRHAQGSTGSLTPRQPPRNPSWT